MPGIALGQTRTQMNDTIPFEMVQGKMVFTGRIDGKPARLILDTGGQNFVVADSVERFGVEFVRDKTVADVNDARIATWTGKVRNFGVGRFWGWQVKEVTVVPGNPFYKEIGVAGAVGGDMFREACLTIDKRNGRFMISYPYRPAGIQRSAGVAMNMDGAYVAVAPVGVGGRSIEVLFDTGASGFFSLSKGDYEKIRDVAPVERRGYGMLYVGAAGIEGAVRDSIYKVNISQMTLPGGKVLNNVGTLVGSHPTSIAGQQLLDHGMLMIDYPRGLLYFFPYDDGPADATGQTRVWNAKILPVVENGQGLFRIVATVGDTPASIGDRVWAINGIDLADEPLSENTVNTLLQNLTEATVTVGQNKKQITIEKI